ncbi:acid type B receptor subunit 2 [Seminavis robusta]|uniref:Acid type B receptor subunit 2 n=1 Tax=Seminavis robusta TaxID=568900 RepID=A0A9N8DSU6_9STRA|nr:acid type B receptor subunit 2 [Seminavis robusta]|eukprot:Sro346_g122700.1 acid type B receptor subunit 2 (776) ;mRNA; r:36801-39304
MLSLLCGGVAFLLLSLPSTAYKFALCPKSVDNPFFDASRDGCFDRARTLGVECLYVGPNVFEKTGSLQASMVQELMDSMDDLDGLSISIRGAEFMRPVIAEAVARGIPVVTFDADDPGSERASYIGTDNYFFGEQLAKTLVQIRPEPGTFGIITDTPTNIVDRERGVRDVLLREGWTEVQESPQYEEGSGELAIDQMRYLSTIYPDITAIIPVMGAPMFLEDKWKELVQEFRNVTFVVADGLPVQLNLLSQNYAHGLVAQLPYEMGARSVDSLLALKKAMEERETTTMPYDVLEDFQGTNCLSHLQIPLVLPELKVDQNHLGNLSIIGFTLFAVIFVTAVGFAVWAWSNRTLAVVRISQPGFLVMVALGALVMGATMLPLSFDDSRAQHNELRGTVMCMSVPWLAFLGFTITFSALLAKTWRINQLFMNSGQFQRVQVTAGQVARPFLLLFAANTIVLTVWTILDPLRYVRLDMEGTDAWNRVLATYGSCQSNNAVPYMSVLGALNLLVLAKANWQAYRARNIKSEFSEAHYIGVTMASMLQATLIGVPLLFLVRDMPQAFYLTLVFMIFTVTMVILLLIFVPKVAFTKRFKIRSRKSQKRIIAESIADSSRYLPGSSGNLGPGRRVSNVSFPDGVRNRGKPQLENTSVQDFIEAARNGHVSDVESGGYASGGRAQGSGSEDSLIGLGSSKGDDEEIDSAARWRASMELAKGIGLAGLTASGVALDTTCTTSVTTQPVHPEASDEDSATGSTREEFRSEPLSVPSSPSSPKEPIS